MHKDIFNNELSCQSGNGEVKVLQTNRGNSEDHSYKGGNEPGGSNRKPERKTCRCGQDGSGVSAYPEKSAVTKGDLTGISDEYIEPYGGYGSDTHRIDNIECVGTAYKGNNQKKDEKSHTKPDPPKICLEDGQLLFVSFLKISARAKLQLSHPI